jgi:hypothetical protein
MANFLVVSNGGQYVADPSFERVWSFSGDDATALHAKVHAAAGQPPIARVDQTDIESGVYGEYLGAYTVPRKASGGGGGTGPTHDELAQAAFEGAQRAEQE